MPNSYVGPCLELRKSSILKRTPLNSVLWKHMSFCWDLNRTREIAHTKREFAKHNFIATGTPYSKILFGFQMQILQKLASMICICFSSKIISLSLTNLINNGYSSYAMYLTSVWASEKVHFLWGSAGQSPLCPPPLPNRMLDELNLIKQHVYVLVVIYSK